MLFRSWRPPRWRPICRRGAQTGSIPCRRCGSSSCQHPVALEDDRFAATQVHAPEAVRRVSDERQPRGSEHPKRGLRTSSSTMARMSAALGPFGPGRFPLQTQKQRPDAEQEPIAGCLSRRFSAMTARTPPGPQVTSGRSATLLKVRIHWRIGDSRRTGAKYPCRHNGL